MALFSFQFKGITFTAEETTQQFKQGTGTYLNSEITNITDSIGNHYNFGHTYRIKGTKTTHYIPDNFHSTFHHPAFNSALIKGLTAHFNRISFYNEMVRA